MDETQTHPLSEQIAEALRQRLHQRRRLPVSTYRLQLRAGFTFREARAIVPYLAKLGITDVYCSPYLRARPGSTHGYDICNHNVLNQELGSESDYQAFVEELAAHHLGQVLDFVPNHMAVDPVMNPWWRDVLEDGPASPFARFFDIDWHPVKPELDGKVLLPILKDHYGLVLERGELRLAFQDGALALRYFEHDLPIDPVQYPRVLRTGLESLQAELPADDTHLVEFLSIITAQEHLPATVETDTGRMAERHREKKVARERLARVVAAAPRIRRHIEDALTACNGNAGQPGSFDGLHELLEQQPYRLAYWRTAFDEINYRRFFDIQDLAGVRMEEPDVFAATHELILRLIREGQVTGLRLDHLDGLFDPAGYVEALQEAVLQEWANSLGPAENTKEEWRQQVRAWRKAEPSIAERPFYVVAEKILSGQETLPESWPIHGTSGYDFLNDLNRLFVEAENAGAMKRVYERFTRRTQPFADVVYECKRLITWTALASELTVLAHALNRLSEGNRRARDFTLNSLREALRETVACFPVYRTYVSSAGATESDRQMIDSALARARRRNPAMEPSVFDFLRQVLLPADNAEEVPPEELRRRLDFAMKFQQYTGPVQAKGMEDTAFYRYNRLLSLNEVGGDPQRFGGVPAQFHEANRRRLRHWPSALLATATHDTKRGEDARARLNVLSEVPNEWRRALFQWTRINAGNRTRVDGEPAPDRNDEYLFYQTLLGAWPAEPEVRGAPADLVERLRDYMLKAVKEAKVHTSWINPHEAYDRAVADFTEKTLTGPRADKFLNSFLAFQQHIARLGMVNSLAQLVLKVLSPGVPDFYQGTELWDLSLVDPDNRRPVDFGRRQLFLEALKSALYQESPGPSGDVSELLQCWPDGRIKLLVTACGLGLRRRLPQVFLRGEYLPLEATGERARHVIGVARRLEEQVVIAIVPRLTASLAATHLPLGPDTWKATRLVVPAGIPSSSFRNVITHESIQPVHESGQVAIEAAQALATCPVALLQKD
jgi:(1->4)-alpha-D-glucan 1-alpha-D-glucosylmutase